MKLYRFRNGYKEYWETWEQSPDRHVIHWGEIGTVGETRIVKSTIEPSAARTIQEEIDSRVAQGFSSISPEDHDVLLIEYQIDGMGSEEDLTKRHQLEDRMNETLGWTGLGACDGGSIGSGTMEVCNFVVDFEIAKKVIEVDLIDTKFANYSRVYRGDIE